MVVFVFIIFFFAFHGLFYCEWSVPFFLAVWGFLLVLLVLDKCLDIEKFCIAAFVALVRCDAQKSLAVCVDRLCCYVVMGISVVEEVKLVVE